MCLASLREQPHSSYHSMARIDGSKRSVGLPLRRLRPAWAATAVRALRASRRERRSLGSAPAAPRMLRRQLSGAAKDAIASLARAPFIFAKPEHLQKSSDGVIASDRALYCRCGPRKVREQFIIVAATRGLPRALPQGRQKLLPRELHTHTRRARDDGCDP